jgi:hypothetical protein
MALPADFTNQVTDAMRFIKFNNNTIVMVAEEAGELRWERLKLFLACWTFCRLFSFPLLVRADATCGCIPFSIYELGVSVNERKKMLVVMTHLVVFRICRP